MGYWDARSISKDFFRFSLLIPETHVAILVYTTESDKENQFPEGEHFTQKNHG